MKGEAEAGRTFYFTSASTRVVALGAEADAVVAEGGRETDEVVGVSSQTRTR